MPDDHEIPPPPPPGGPVPRTWERPVWAEAPPPPPGAPPPPPGAAPAQPFGGQADPFGGPPAWALPGDAARPQSAPGKGPAAIFELRPLSTGEILDRTFSLYRKRFWLFAGIATVASVVTTLSAFVQLTWGTVRTPVTPNPGDPFAVFRGPEFQVLIITAVITSVVYFFVYCLTQAATVHAVSEVYLGRETTIGSSLRSVRRHWLRYCAVAFWQGWSYVWLPLTLFALAFGCLAAGGAGRGLGGMAVLAGLLFLAAALSIFYGIYAYMRNSLGIVVAVVEDVRVGEALRRSKELTHHRLLRVLTLFLLLFVLGIAASAARAIPGFFFGIFLQQHKAALAVVSQGLALIAVFASGVLLLPVGAISFVLFYIDERVRREGFDIETLLGQQDGPPRPDGPLGPAELPSPFSGSGLV